ncbi:phosphotransferase, partial [Pseudomonas aeruginosa]
YQVGIEDGEPLIAKFYRPDRWSDAAIREEHAFCAELAECEVPVVAPLSRDGESLFAFSGFRFALFPRRGGRAPAAPREQGEAEAGECEQAFAVARQRRHHRHLAFRQLGAEGVLLADRRVAPAVRSVELGDQRLAVLDADLV